VVDAAVEVTAGVEAVLTTSVKGDALSIQLPLGMGGLSGVATEQLICTAAAALRITTPSADRVTADVTDGSGRHAKGSDEHCPDL
jgi:hypothetical protein